MIEREYDRDATATGSRRREPEAPAPLQAGTREWASAVGNATVARMAAQRQVAREAEEEQEGAEAEGAAAAPDELDQLPEDELPE